MCNACMDGNEHNNQRFINFCPNVRNIVCEEVIIRSKEKKFAVIELNRKIDCWFGFNGFNVVLT